MTDFIARLKQALDKMPPGPEMVVGLSGGVDSVVLLHSLTQLRLESVFSSSLRALHVNHGLHPQADSWQQFCMNLCKDLKVPFTAERVAVTATGSVESMAREARYRVFAASLENGAALMLAQHLDDQLETLFLRLMRGAGPRGLAGMPHCRPLGAGILYRPFLDFTRAELVAQARAAALEWIEDPSNADTGPDRNYLRHRVLPLVEARWPDYRIRCSRSSDLLREADTLLDEMARDDLESIGSHDGAGLELEPLLKLSAARQRNLLRHWLSLLALPVPGWHQLQELSRELGGDFSQRESGFELDGVSLQQHRGYLFAVKLGAASRPTESHWNAVDQTLKSLPGNGQLQARHRIGRGLGRLHADNLEIRYRQGGESIRLPGRPTKSLKKLLQEAGVATWLRCRLPLLYRDEHLVCVPGIGPREDCAAGPDEEGIVIDWHAPDFAQRPA